MAALANVPGEPARLISGAADRSVMLWDKEGRVQARLELGAGVTVGLRYTITTCSHNRSTRTSIKLSFPSGCSTSYCGTDVFFCSEYT